MPRRRPYCYDALTRTQRELIGSIIAEFAWLEGALGIVTMSVLQGNPTHEMVMLNMIPDNRRADFFKLLSDLDDDFAPYRTRVKAVLKRYEACRETRNVFAHAFWMGATKPKDATEAADSPVRGRLSPRMRAGQKDVWWSTNGMRAALREMTDVNHELLNLMRDAKEKP